MAAIHVGAVFAELGGLSLRVSAFEHDLFPNDKLVSPRARYIYHVSSGVMYVMFMWVALQTLSIMRDANRETSFYEKNSRKLLIVIASLSAAEILRTTTNSFLFDRDLSPSDLAAYGAIFCLGVIAVVMFRGRSTRRYYDGSI
jgi:hypothetical protein